MTTTNLSKGQIIDGYEMKYGVPEKVIKIYGKYIEFRTPQFIDGIGTFDATEDVKELQQLKNIGSINF